MKRLLSLVAVAALIVIGFVVFHHSGEHDGRYTGFVEGEERLLRSEVSGRVLDVNFREGDPVPASAVVARIDDADIAARAQSARQQVDVLSRQIEQAVIEADLREASWKQDLRTRESEAEQARADVELAARTAQREEGLARSGATTKQMLDDTRNRLSTAKTSAERAANVLERTRAEEATIAAARAHVEVLRGQKALAASQLAELEVTHAKFQIRSPNVPTIAQTQLLWPGELAQPGTPVFSVLDPRDKYVQIYVPVPDLDRVKVGTKMDIELDSNPGKRWPGEVTFIAERANFTPEKIETRSDRVGQVYRVKVRILEGVENFTVGSESDVYISTEAPR
ncbi:MAG TPA: HlyD family efflux transporter periplasmic adaptor subunit [Candidatus Limnocylindrales bacterium]|nr:HlyD family efflux transporter periplasmic adaptor subunit [Candidatus Limnocylindrales bacterium]